MTGSSSESGMPSATETGPALRVAILADTHGFLDPRVAACVSESDLAVHAGDIGGADVLLSLHPRGEVVAVRGNNDTPERWQQGEEHMLETLPREAGVDLPGGRLVVVHGDDGGTLEARHRRYRRRFSDAGAVVYGHSHRLLVDREACPWLLNPGAAGRTRTQGGPSCLLLDCRESGWVVHERRFEHRKYPLFRREGKRTQSTDSAPDG